MSQSTLEKNEARWKRNAELLHDLRGEPGGVGVTSADARKLLADENQALVNYRARAFATSQGCKHLLSDLRSAANYALFEVLESAKKPSFKLDYFQSILRVAISRRMREAVDESPVVGPCSRVLRGRRAEVYADKTTSRVVKSLTADELARWLVLHDRIAAADWYAWHCMTDEYLSLARKTVKAFLEQHPSYRKLKIADVLGAEGADAMLRYTHKLTLPHRVTRRTPAGMVSFIRRRLSIYCEHEKTFSQFRPKKWKHVVRFASAADPRFRSEKVARTLPAGVDPLPSVLELCETPLERDIIKLRAAGEKLDEIAKQTGWSISYVSKRIGAIEARYDRQHLAIGA